MALIHCYATNSAHGVASRRLLELSSPSEGVVMGINYVGHPCQSTTTRVDQRAHATLVVVGLHFTPSCAAFIFPDQ